MNDKYKKGKIMISYKPVKNSRNVKVFLKGKLVGVIEEVDGGFAYFPKGFSVKGSTFKTIEDAKKTL